MRAKIFTYTWLHIENIQGVCLCAFVCVCVCVNSFTLTPTSPSKALPTSVDVFSPVPYWFWVIFPLYYQGRTYLGKWRGTARELQHRRIRDQGSTVLWGRISLLEKTRPSTLPIGARVRVVPVGPSTLSAHGTSGLLFQACYLGATPGRPSRGVPSNVR